MKSAHLTPHEQHGRRIEVIYEAIASVMPESVPAWSGSDLCALVWWGTREATGEPWADGSPHPIGQGAFRGGDGGTMMHIGQSSTRIAPTEVWEAKNPWLVEKIELATDSCGAGTYRGGLGVDMHFLMLKDAYLTSATERCSTPAWGLAGGREGRPNGVAIRYSDGTRKEFGKITRLKVPKGAAIELRCGGGGGYGTPKGRAVHHIDEDLREGYVTQKYVREYYPQAQDHGTKTTRSQMFPRP